MHLIYAARVGTCPREGCQSQIRPYVRLHPIHVSCSDFQTINTSMLVQTRSLVDSGRILFASTQSKKWRRWFLCVNNGRWPNIVISLQSSLSNDYFKISFFQTPNSNSWTHIYLSIYMSVCLSVLCYSYAQYSHI